MEFAVGVEGNWSQNKHKDVGVVVDLGGGDTYTLNKDNLKLLSGTVDGMYKFPVSEASKISPFALVGVGIYNAKEDYEETIVIGGSTTINTDESDGVKGTSRLGGKFGVGGMYKATELMGISLQGDFNIVSVDTNGAPAGTPSTFKFWQVRAGLNWHIMPK